MKSALTITVFIFLASTLLCTEAHAQKTSARYDESVNFSNYKTFAFDKSGARNPYVNTMIVEAVERELTSRGLTKVAADPDLRVVYLAATGPNLQVADVPFYQGPQSSLQRTGVGRLVDNVGRYDGHAGDRSV